MNIKELINSNLERYSTSPYEIGDRYHEGVKLYTKDVEFDSQRNFVLASSDESDTGAEEESLGSKSYIRIYGDEFVWNDFVEINEAAIALNDILYAIMEHGMPVEVAVCRVFPEARRKD